MVAKNFRPTSRGAKGVYLGEGCDDAVVHGDWDEINGYTASCA